MRPKNLLQGESYTMTFIVKENGSPHNIRSDEYIAVGLYDESGNKCVLYSKNGQILNIGNGIYKTTFTGNMTKDIVGQAVILIVIYNNDKSRVCHSNKTIQLYFDERSINCDI